MAGIYSQGGSAGHRYAGWLSEVEAKNFQFGGKVFNGSPSAIYVGSNLVWPWLTIAAQQAIVGAFGQRDGWAVIKATNAYLNQLAASDMDKAQAIADFMNESPTHAVGYATFIYEYQEVEYIQGTGTQYMQTDTPAGEYEVDTKVEVTGDTSVNGYGVAFISNTENVSGLGQFYYSGAYRYFGPSGYNKTFSVNTLLNLHIKEKDGVYQLISNGETIYEGTRNYPSPAGNLVLMARTKGTKSIARLKQYTIVGTLNGSDMYVIPCYHKTNGTIGMYDVVNNKFYENSGTGTFLKGADVNPTPSTH